MSWRSRLGRFGWVVLATVLTALGMLALPQLSGGEAPAWTLAGEKWELSSPRVLLLALALPLLALGAGSSLTGLSLGQRLLSLLLRIGFLAALLLAIAEPVAEQRSDRICALALVDASQSMGEEALALIGQQLGALASKKRPGDQLRLFAFGQSLSEVPLAFDAQGALLPPTAAEFRTLEQGEATDLQRALELAAAFEQDNCLNRVFVWSDGISTRGSVAPPLAEASARGTRIDFFPQSKAPERDVAVTRMAVDEDVAVGEPFMVRVELTATRKSRGQLRLYQGAMLNGLEGAREVVLPRGESMHAFKSVVRVGGDVRYHAQFVPEQSDQFEANNDYLLTLEVPGPPRVLLVDRRPDQASYLAQALVAQQLDVDVRGPGAFPRSARELAEFQFVILSDLRQIDVSRGAQGLLSDYVRGGGGLLFSGGEAGYGPGGWEQAPLSRILPVTMSSQKEREIPGVAMVLVIDRSGSMTGLPLEMAKEACKATLQVLERNDLLEVIAFDSRPLRAVTMQPARYRAKIETSIASITPGGGTEIFNSLDMAFQDLSVVEARRKHIVLLTDGNAGSDGIYELASTSFSEGITMTSVGLGGGVNQALLKMIAEAGGGRFHAASDPSRLPRIFTRETELISKKATLDDWFPVQQVGAASFLKGVGLGSAPLLRGYTSTQLRPQPSQLILASDRGEPLLARRRVGQGWSLAWTSDLKARWAVDWLKWRSFGNFMAQMVREHQARDDAVVRPMQVELLGDELLARVDAFDEDENFDSSLKSVLHLRMHSSSGEQSAARNEGSREVAFRLVAPGRYEARIKLEAYGSYSLKATHHRSSAGQLLPAGVSYGAVSLPYPEEYKNLNPRPRVVEAWAKAARGRVNPPDALAWDPRGDVVVARVAKWPLPLLVAMVLFFLDLLVRRLRLFDRHPATPAK